MAIAPLWTKEFQRWNAETAFIERLGFPGAGQLLLNARGIPTPGGNKSISRSIISRLASGQRLVPVCSSLECSALKLKEESQLECAMQSDASLFSCISAIPKHAITSTHRFAGLYSLNYFDFSTFVSISYPLLFSQSAVSATPATWLSCYTQPQLHQSSMQMIINKTAVSFHSFYSLITLVISCPFS